MKFFRPFNIFTMLMIVAGFAFAFRLVNIFTFSDKPAHEVGAIMPAGAQEAVNEQPPPLTREDIERAVRETARKADEKQEDAAPPTRMAQAADRAMPPPPEDEDDAHAFTASEIEVLQALSQRRENLDKRERMIADKEALLEAAAQEVDRKIAELNKLKAEMERLLGTQQQMEEGRLKSLVKIYEGMKPKEAAIIFNTLDLDVLLAIIGNMNERKATPIMAEMDPEKARIVTIRLAEQRKLPGGKTGGGGMMPQQ